MTPCHLHHTPHKGCPSCLGGVATGSEDFGEPLTPESLAKRLGQPSRKGKRVWHLHLGHSGVAIALACLLVGLVAAWALFAIVSPH